MPFQPERFANTPTPGVTAVWATLTAGVNASATTLALSTAWPSHTRLLIGTEWMRIVSGFGTTSIVVERGVEGSTAASHALGAEVAGVETAGMHRNNPLAMTAPNQIVSIDANGTVIALDGDFYLTPAQAAAAYQPIGDYLSATLPGDGKLLFDDGGALGGFGSWDGMTLETPGLFVKKLSSDSVRLQVGALSDGYAEAYIRPGFIAASGDEDANGAPATPGAFVELANFAAWRNDTTAPYTTVVLYASTNVGTGANLIFDSLNNVAIGNSNGNTVDFTIAHNNFVIDGATGNGQFRGTIAASNLSGTNNGDQDLSAYALTANVQPIDADLTAIAALATNGFAKRTGSGTWVIDASTYLASVAPFTLATNTVEQRNGTNPQTLRVYETTDGGTANYSRLSISAPTGAAVKLTTEAAGTGTARGILVDAPDITLRATNGGMRIDAGNPAVQLRLEVFGVDAYLTNSYAGAMIFRTDNGTERMRLANSGLVTFAGDLKFGTHAAIAAETVTGYITITDAGGTTRKLAVVS